MIVSSKKSRKKVHLKAYFLFILLLCRPKNVTGVGTLIIRDKDWLVRVFSCLGSGYLAVILVNNDNDDSHYWNKREWS